MYDNFHHLAPEIIEAFGSLCENEDIGFTLYSALCESTTSATFISPSHTRSNGRMDDRFNQDSRTRAFQTPTTIQRESTLYSADEDDGSAGHRMYMKPSTAIDQWKGLYKTNVSRSIWVMTLTYNTAHVILSERASPTSAAHQILVRLKLIMLSCHHHG
jgi:hypothetical protein